MRTLRRFLFASLITLTSSSAFAIPITLTGFESGTTGGFTFDGSGSVQVMSSLGGLLPYIGNSFALLSNGPDDQGGSPGDRAELRSDSFALTAADTLTIAIRRLTAEFTGGAADPSRLDSFAVRLLPVAGPATDLHVSDVSDPAFSLLPSLVSAPTGDTFFEATNWQLLTATGLTGTFQLQFSVADAGDNAFDSAFMIDADTTASVSEPMTALMVAAGAVLGARAKRSKRVSPRRSS